MSSKLKNRHRLKSKEIRNIKNIVEQRFNDVVIDEKSVFEVGDYEDIKLVVVDEVPCFMYVDDILVFTLQGLNFFKPSSFFVVVDMGAVKFVANGADVMTPGIVDVDENIEKDDFVWICDVKNRKPLAVGFALISGVEMKETGNGKAVRNIHYVGDDIWSFVAKSL